MRHHLATGAGQQAGAAIYSLSRPISRRRTLLCTVAARMWTQGYVDKKYWVRNLNRCSTCAASRRLLGKDAEGAMINNRYLPDRSHASIRTCDKRRGLLHLPIRSHRDYQRLRLVTSHQLLLRIFPVNHQHSGDVDKSLVVYLRCRRSYKSNFGVIATLSLCHSSTAPSISHYYPCHKG